MRKSISYIFFSIFFLSSAITVNASNALLTISVPDSAKINDNITVNIFGTGFTASDDITALSFWINYDHRVLQYVGFIPSQIAGNNITLGTAITDNIGITWDGGVGSKLILNNQNFITLNFKVISDKKATVDFKVSNISAANNLGDLVSFKINSTSIIINKDSTQEMGPQIISNPVVSPPYIPPNSSSNPNNNGLPFTPTYTPFYIPSNQNDVPSKFIPTYPPRDFAPKVAPIIYSPKVVSLVNSSFSFGTFDKDLQLGSNDPDVVRLQKYLNFNKYTIALSGPGSVGNESTYFGESTYTALKKFQADNGIPSTGYFGPVTRKLFSK